MKTAEQQIKYYNKKHMPMIYKIRNKTFFKFKQYSIDPILQETVL